MELKNLLHDISSLGIGEGRVTLNIRHTKASRLGEVTFHIKELDTHKGRITTRVIYKAILDLMQEKEFYFEKGNHPHLSPNGQDALKSASSYAMELSNYKSSASNDMEKFILQLLRKTIMEFCSQHVYDPIGFFPEFTSSPEDRDYSSAFIIVDGRQKFSVQIKDPPFRAHLAYGGCTNRTSSKSSLYHTFSFEPYAPLKSIKNSGEEGPAASLWKKMARLGKSEISNKFKN